MKLKTGVCMVMLALGGVMSSEAEDVPSLINYQGTLYDPSANGGTGGNLSGMQTVQFRIYDQASGGTLLWAREFPVSCSAAGVFNVLLNDNGTALNGSTNTLANTFEGQNRFLELTVVGHGSAIAPRQQLVSAPYALHAQLATSAKTAPSGFTVNSGLLVYSGGATINGALVANTNLSVNGPAQFKAGVTVTAGDLSVTNGRIRDKTGFLMPVGSVMPFAGSTAPAGWLLCDGSSKSTTDYADLYAVIAHTYGGSGSAFNVPDFRGRGPMGYSSANTSFNTMGKTNGAETHVMTVAEMPSHDHALRADGKATVSYGNESGDQMDHKGSDGTGNVDPWTTIHNTQSRGGGAAFNVLDPYMVLNFIIKY